MSISCEIVKDLLPLYQENVCSEESKDIVEKHLIECISCREVMAKMKNDGLDETLEAEKTTILDHCIQKVNKVSKFLGIGCTTLITIPIVTGVFIGLFVSKNITMSNIILSALIIGIAYFVGFYFDVPLKFMGSQYGKTKRKSFYIGIWLAVLYMIPIIVSFIVNLAADKTLDYFYTVLAAHFLAASVTVVPLILPEKKFLWTIISFTGSLLFLILVVGLIDGDTDVWVSTIGTLFGMSVVFLPYVLRNLLVKGKLSKHKGLIYMTVNTILLYLIVILAVYPNHNSDLKPDLVFMTLTLLYPWGMFLIIRYLPYIRLLKTGFSIVLTGLYLWLLPIGTYSASDGIYLGEGFGEGNLVVLSSIFGIGLLFVMIGCIRKWIMDNG
ncbi:MAG: zf-HC2 domain-containing protein [Candidatus Cloacimonetes bacterium]|nr:zf-HC2 domain-containing protein [Candidatus Cloacimonadota bacterium]